MQFKTKLGLVDIPNAEVLAAADVIRGKASSDQHDKAWSLVNRIANQKPEKPDYWSECGQCGRNAADADDIINP